MYGTNMPIFGEITLPAFGSVSPSASIDLNDYSKLTPKPVMEGEFVGLFSLNLDDVDPIDMEQDDIREEGNLGERVENLEDSYEVNGLVTTEWPPMFTVGFREDGTPYLKKCIDGRGRILAAIKRNEKFIPVAGYRMDDDYEEAALLENAVKSNEPKLAQTNNTMGDYVRCYIAIYAMGKRGKKDVDISAWFARMGIPKRYPRDASQNDLFNKIKRAIAAYDAGESFVRPYDTAKAKKWVKENGYESFSPFVLKVDDERYATRLLFDVIVNRMMMDRDPVDLILYSGKTEEKMYKQNMRDFMKKLETDYVAMFKVVAKVKELGDLPVPDYRPWNAKGCIPQVKGQSYSVDGPKLVPLNKIVK